MSRRSQPAIRVVASILLLSSLTIRTAQAGSYEREQKKLEKARQKAIEEKNSMISEERKAALKLKRPLNELLEIAREKCPVSPKRDKLDYLLLRIPAREVGAVTYASKKAAAEERGEKRRRSGGEGAYAGGVAAGAAAYGSALKNWDWTEYDRRAEAKAETKFNKQTRQNSLDFVCLYQQGADMGLMRTNMGNLYPVLLDPLLVARATGGTDEWAEGFNLSARNIPLDLEDKAKLLSEATEQGLRRAEQANGDFALGYVRTYLWAFHSFAKTLPAGSVPASVLARIDAIAAKAGLDKANCKDISLEAERPSCLELQQKVFPGMTPPRSRY